MGWGLAGPGFLVISRGAAVCPSWAGGRACETIALARSGEGGTRLSTEPLPDSTHWPSGGAPSHTAQRKWEPDTTTAPPAAGPGCPLAHTCHLGLSHPIHKMGAEAVVLQTSLLPSAHLASSEALGLLSREFRGRGLRTARSRW